MASGSSSVVRIEFDSMAFQLDVEANERVSDLRRKIRNEVGYAFRFAYDDTTKGGGGGGRLFLMELQEKDMLASQFETLFVVKKQETTGPYQQQSGMAQPNAALSSVATSTNIQPGGLSASNAICIDLSEDNEDDNNTTKPAANAKYSAVVVKKEPGLADADTGHSKMSPTQDSSSQVEEIACGRKIKIEEQPNPTDTNIETKPPAVAVVTPRNSDASEPPASTTTPFSRKRVAKKSSPSRAAARRKTHLQGKANKEKETPQTDHPTINTASATDRQDTPAAGGGGGGTQKVKLEGLATANLIKFSKSKRKYGDRLLIHRAKDGGIKRLGGCTQHTHPVPRAGHPRFQDIGDIYVLCFSGLWQGDAAPLYAGQQKACVDYLPAEAKRDKSLAFAVFMSRCKTGFGPSVTTKGADLGWEYVGNYRYAGDEEVQSTWMRATVFSEVAKRKQFHGIFNSSQSQGDNAYGRIMLREWRERLAKELKNDLSEGGPQWLVEKRHPTDEELTGPPASLSARARALGFHESISDEALARLIVDLDEEHVLIPIEFVEYDERIYEYVKGTPTSHDAQGKLVSRTLRPPATAQAWYDFLDQQVLPS